MAVPWSARPEIADYCYKCREPASVRIVGLPSLAAPEGAKEVKAIHDDQGSQCEDWLEDLVPGDYPPEHNTPPQP